MNDNLILLCGKSAAGKSTALMGLKDQSGVIYLNTESGKKLPFRNKFKKITVTDPMQVYTVFLQAEEMPEVHTIVVDSLTYLMQMFEMIHVKTAENTLAAWGTYGDYYINLMQQYVAKSTKNVIFTAHTTEALTEDGLIDTHVKVAGKLMNNGIESWFSQIVTAKKMSLKALQDYKNDLLNITEDDELLGYKHVIQTRLTKQTIGEKIRGPIGMWDRKETYIDSDVQTLIDRCHEYYEDV